ncbi:unnamed protein product [Rotaria sp. Silwood2]|nr:unnamed protein product [Rotaria sp. Silwood2]CAF3301410.1 unnamed protein product [Rotaria sp. Silwood2]CAF4261343.1 unnamed protein product [Rotaria sp. Silwood2]
MEKVGIARVSSSSHSIQVDLSQLERYVIEFAQENAHLDRDILLDIDLIKNRSNIILAVETGAVMASLTPTDEDCRRATSNTALPDEFIFVIDCSGPMRHENKIDNYRPLFPDITTVYNEENVRKAEEFTKKMQADLGGTELLKPLQWFDKNRPKQGHTRQIFLLTDGEISNVNEVLDLCRSISNFTRIFSFGLGHSPSHSLIKGLARTTNGRFVFIHPNENVDIYIGDQLQKALQSCITNIQVKWNINTTVMHASTKLLPVYANNRLIVYALANDQTSTFDPNSTVELYTDQC